MSLRALDTDEPLQRFVDLTREIRALEKERDALKGEITEALYREPTDGPGQPFVDFSGFRIELACRPRYTYTEAVQDLEKQLRELKAKERKTGAAFVESLNYHPRCTPLESTRETVAREKKATAIAGYLSGAGLDTARVAAMDQAQRDDIARRAGQRSPSEKTWGVVLQKMAA